MKVGDIVKIKEEVRNLCGSEDFVNDMKKYIGKQARITEDRPFHIYKLDIDGGKWNWTDNMLEPVSSKKYEVIVEENTVTVTDDKGNTGVAKYSPEDEFNLSTGITLAIERLKWKPNQHESYWTIDFSYLDCVCDYRWEDDYTDNRLFKNGVVFKTKKEAIKVAKRMLEII